MAAGDRPGAMNIFTIGARGPTRPGCYSGEASAPLVWPRPPRRRGHCRRRGRSARGASRGDWIRTSDLLNPIEEAWRANSSENTSLSQLAAFQAFDILQEFAHFS